jgi:hypothetical protein
MSDKRMDPERPIITRTFHDRESAERAYNAIAARGYKSDDIHVIMTDETRARLFAKDKDKERTGLGNKALEGGGVGGAVGGAVGATVVGIAAAATALTIPGLGLVIVGPLAGAIAGGAAGATAGGIIGLLVGAGIPKERAKEYEKELKEGGIVVGVRPRHEEDARYFESEWDRAQGTRSTYDEEGRPSLGM